MAMRGASLMKTGQARLGDDGYALRRAGLDQHRRRATPPLGDQLGQQPAEAVADHQRRRTNLVEDAQRVVEVVLDPHPVTLCPAGEGVAVPPALGEEPHIALEASVALPGAVEEHERMRVVPAGRHDALESRELDLFHAVPPRDPWSTQDHETIMVQSGLLSR